MQSHGQRSKLISQGVMNSSKCSNR